MKSNPLLHVQDHPIPLGDQPADLVITTFHGESEPVGPLADLMERHREKLDGSDQDVFDTYLALEVDTYSQDLARRVWKLLSEAVPSIRMRYLEFRAQRGILDMNRAQVKDARRKLWLPTHTDIWMGLSAIHTGLIRAFEANVPQGQFESALDLHTMYPFSPVLDEDQKQAGLQTVGEKRGSLKAYVGDYIEAEERGGMRRPLDLLTADDQGNIHVNQAWAKTMQVELAGSEVHELKENVPYHLGGKDLTGKRLVGRTRNRGLILDIPKDYLAYEKAPNGLYLPSRKDPQKIDQLARAIVESYLKTHRRA